MIGRDVEQDAGGRVERRGKIDLVGRALDHEEPAVLRRIERQHRAADIATELCVATARGKDMRDQRRGRGLAVRAGDRDERAMGRMRPTFPNEDLDISDDLDALGPASATDQCGFG